jgi:LysM repeat protein
VHAVVLLVAVAISGYASVNRQLPEAAMLRLGVVNAEGMTFGQGGTVGDVSMGRLSTIIKPVGVPTQPTVRHTPTTYTVQPGDDLEGIAAKFGVTMDDIRWSNPSLTKTDVVSEGQTLVIPPVSGIVVPVNPGDSVQSLAAAYHVDPTSIVDFNYLRDPQRLPVGSQLVVPGGRGPDLFPRRVSDQPPHMGPYDNSKFAYGNCTWYVASRRPVPWTGDAWMWFGGARAMGFKTGNTPQPGAIMVTWESWIGHVAYVESVNADGSFTVSEMNYKGWGIISTRLLRVNQVPLIGFIY